MDQFVIPWAIKGGIALQSGNGQLVLNVTAKKSLQVRGFNFWWHECFGNCFLKL